MPEDNNSSFKTLIKKLAGSGHAADAAAGGGAIPATRRMLPELRTAGAAAAATSDGSHSSETGTSERDEFGAILQEIKGGASVVARAHHAISGSIHRVISTHRLLSSDELTAGGGSSRKLRVQ